MNAWKAGEGCAANFKWLLQARFLMKCGSVKPQHYISIMLSPQGGQLGGPSTLLKVQKQIFQSKWGKTVVLREFRVRLQFSWELALRPWYFHTINLYWWKKYFRALSRYGTSKEPPPFSSSREHTTWNGLYVLLPRVISNCQIAETTQRVITWLRVLLTIGVVCCFSQWSADGGTEVSTTGLTTARLWKSYSWISASHL